MSDYQNTDLDVSENFNVSHDPYVHVTDYFENVTESITHSYKTSEQDLDIYSESRITTEINTIIMENLTTVDANSTRQSPDFETFTTLNTNQTDNFSNETTSNEINGTESQPSLKTTPETYARDLGLTTVNSINGTELFTVTDTNSSTFGDNLVGNTTNMYASEHYDNSTDFTTIFTAMDAITDNITINISEENHENNTHNNTSAIEMHSGPPNGTTTTTESTNMSPETTTNPIPSEFTSETANSNKSHAFSGVTQWTEGTEPRVNTTQTLAFNGTVEAKAAMHTESGPSVSNHSQATTEGPTESIVTSSATNLAFNLSDPFINNDTSNKSSERDNETLARHYWLNNKTRNHFKFNKSTIDVAAENRTTPMSLVTKRKKGKREAD